MTTISLRIGTLSFVEEILGFSHKEVETHSIQYSFAMEIFPVRVYPETITIIGRWSSNAFLRYIWIQVSGLSKFIRYLMVPTRAFYTIPKAEVIYYTPGQPGVQYHNLNPQRVITNNTSSYLLLPRWNGPQGRNTHTTCSEISKQATRKYGSSTFYPQRPLPRIPEPPEWKAISNFSLEFNFRYRCQKTRDYNIRSAKTVVGN